MGRKKTPGLQKRNGVWIIDKKIFGMRVCESTGTHLLEKAEEYLLRRLEQIREARIFGVRPTRTFREAATRYLLDKQDKASIADDALHLKQLDSFIGEMNIEQVHIGSLQPFIKARQKVGVKTKSINLALGVVRHILNLASSEWLDENGLTWLHVAPKIKMLPVNDARSPYPLSWEEQDKLFNELPLHLRRMALFKINTGCREQEVCNLQWNWEIKMPELNTSIFLIPKEMVKNRQDRLVVLNEPAKAVVDETRGINPDYVFTYNGHPLTAMHNSAWKRARKAVRLQQVRVHDLKHTFGRRLRAAGVSFEDGRIC
jgi:integrase